MQELGWNLVDKGTAAQAAGTAEDLWSRGSLIDETEIELSSLVRGEIADTSVNW